MNNYYIRRFRRNERGATLVEFAIAIPVLLLLIFGIMEFGWIFHGWVTLTAAAREGARLAIVNESEINIKGAVTSHAPIFNLAPGDITITWAEGRGKNTTVTIDGELPLLTGFLPIGNPYELSVGASMRHE